MNFKKLITQDESETVEFKKSAGEWKEIIETICAFANVVGGRIFIGVSKSGKILGAEVGKATIEDPTNKKTIFTPEISLKLGLNERQIEAIKFIEKHGKIATKDYCDLLGVARDTANRDLSDLLKKRLIVKKGSGPQIYYKLSDLYIGQYRTVSDSKVTKRLMND